MTAFERVKFERNGEQLTGIVTIEAWTGVEFMSLVKLDDGKRVQVPSTDIQFLNYEIVGGRSLK